MLESNFVVVCERNHNAQQPQCASGSGHQRVHLHFEGLLRNQRSAPSPGSPAAIVANPMPYTDAPRGLLVSKGPCRTMLEAAISRRQDSAWVGWKRSCSHRQRHVLPQAQRHTSYTKTMVIPSVPCSAGLLGAGASLLFSGRSRGPHRALQAPVCHPHQACQQHKCDDNPPSQLRPPKGGFFTSAVPHTCQRIHSKRCIKASKRQQQTTMNRGIPTK